MRWLAATAAACVIAMTVSCASLCAVSRRHRVAARRRRSRSSPSSTSSMFVDQSAAPNSPATEFTAPNIENVTPGSRRTCRSSGVCADLLGTGFHSSRDLSRGSTTSTPDTSSIDELRVFHLFLSVPVERPDFVSTLGSVKRSPIKASPQTRRSCAYRGCRIGLPQPASSRKGPTVPGSSVFVVVFTSPWRLLRSPAATSRPTTRTLW